MVVRQEDEYVATLYMKSSDMSLVDICDLRLKQKDVLKSRLRELSRCGCRTVIYSYRQLSRSETRELREVWETSKWSYYRENDRLDKWLKRLQSRVKLLGVSLMQDEVEPGAFETVRMMKGAGCAVWVVTGDTAAGALQAGVASGIVRNYGRVFNIGSTWRKLHNQRSQQTRLNDPASLYREYRRVRVKSGSLTLMISGNILSGILSTIELQTAVVLMCCDSDGVILYRTTPAQGSLMVRTLNLCLSPSPIVVALCSGSGEVPMLESVDIGLGILARSTAYGVSEVCRAADISLNSLVGVTPLLMSHGITCLERNTRLVMYMIVVSCMTVFPILLQGFVSNSGSKSLYGISIPLIVFVIAFFPPLAFLIYSHTSRYDLLSYRISRSRRYFRLRNLFFLTFEAFFLSGILVLITVYTLHKYGINSSGRGELLSCG